MNDYPAAHSMDTTWFAVDANGEVAAFVSGEMGAVPLAGQMEGDLQAFIDLLPASSDGFPTIEVDPRYMFEKVLNDTHCYDEYFLCEIAPDRLTNIDTFQPEFVIQCASGTNTYIVMTWALDEKEIAELCTRYRPISDIEIHQLLGIYSYEHEEEAWDGDDYVEGLPPYKQLAQPQQPIKITALAAKPRAFVQSVVFDTVTFSDSPSIQPLEHKECATWSLAGYPYLGADGEVKGEIPEPTLMKGDGLVGCGFFLTIIALVSAAIYAIFA